VLSTPGDWTIICCSIPKRDPVRAWKFFDACERLGARGRLIPQIEPDWDDPLGVGSLVDWHEFEFWVTHGADGEYGHPHHKSLHEVVRRNAMGQVWFHQVRNGVHHVDLGAMERSHEKLRALQAYDHILDYQPLGKVTKWEALLHRYSDTDPLQGEYYSAR
jgi:hypothetical protein